MDAQTVCWLAVVISDPGGKDNPESICQDLLNEFQHFHPMLKELLLKSYHFIRNDLADLGEEKRKWYHNKVY